MSFMERLYILCSLFGVSFKRGSTVVVTQYLCMYAMLMYIAS